MAQKRGITWLCGFIVILIVMVVFWLYYPELITKIFPKLDSVASTDKGVFGDMFGSLNALFSGIALVGVIYTILMQRQELKFFTLQFQLLNVKN